jgi:uncharacterized membrane protein YsdA (DUF1294 family)/cold shock CspA family protein
MRLAGRITDWNDDKGFGFVVPHGGGARAFVHINEFQRGSRRPVDGDMISYLPGMDARGRTNARQVRHAGQRIEAPRTPSRIPRAALGVAILAGATAAAVAGFLPAFLAGVYFAASALSYLMYRWDKAAALNDLQRTPEVNLHLVDLLGGWPGALVAQQQFRHKTAKQSFQVIFLATVVVNVVVAAWLTRSGLAAELSAWLGG